MLRQIVIGRPNGIRRTVIKKTWELVRNYFDDNSSTTVATYSPERNSTATDSTAGQQEEQNHEPPKGVTPPEGFEVVLHKDALDVDNVTQVIIAGTAIALARTSDGFFAIENNCPHAGGPMSEGWLEGSQISCPYHGWAFDLRDGKCATNPESCIQTYEVQVLEDAVCVKL